MVSPGHQIFDPVHLDALLVFDLIQAVCHRLVGAEEGLRPLLRGVDVLDDKHQAGGLLLVGLMRLIKLDERLLHGDETCILILDTGRVVLHSLLDFLA